MGSLLSRVPSDALTVVPEWAVWAILGLWAAAVLLLVADSVHQLERPIYASELPRFEVVDDD